MKNVIALLFMLTIRLTTFSQDCSELRNNSEMRQELQDMANSAANQLKNCCSSFGANNIKAEIYWDKDESGVCQTRISKLTGKIIITMTASWTGSLSGTQYWIKGRLVVDMDSRSRSWEKIADSGGFKPGCSGSCIY